MCLWKGRERDGTRKEGELEERIVAKAVIPTKYNGEENEKLAIPKFLSLSLPLT